MQHDDVIGEEVCQEEAEAVQTEIVSAIMGPAACELRFPGSQPVSLAASNIYLLSQHRYYVTWKADGTRYMLYISVLGTYLVDRSFSVRRVQMRWPTAAPRSKLQYDPEIPQHGTLLDGEMIVDEDKATGKQARRYLAYDMMQLCGRPLRNATFKVRHTCCFLLGDNFAPCCSLILSMCGQSPANYMAHPFLHLQTSVLGCSLCAECVWSNHAYRHSYHLPTRVECWAAQRD